MNSTTEVLVPIVSGMLGLSRNLGLLTGASVMGVAVAISIGSRALSTWRSSTGDAS